jgi:cbb3-type cytochrome oxidase subunit 3
VNPVLQAAAETVSLGWLLGMMTVVFVVWFVGWTVWAYLPRNKAMMEEAARMPLTDGGDS